MENSGKLCPAGDEAHILPCDDTHGDNADEIDGHRRRYGQAGGYKQLHIAAGADEAGRQAVHSPGGSAHNKAGAHGPGKGFEGSRRLPESNAHEYEVHDRHDKIAHQGAYGGAVDVYGGLSHQEPVDNYLYKSAADKGYHGQLLLAGGLKHGVFHQYKADEEGGHPHNTQQSGAGGVAVGVEQVHYGITHHCQPDAHGHGDEGGDAHGILCGFHGFCPAASGEGGGDGGDDGYCKRRDKGGRQIEQSHGLAVDPVKHLGFIVTEAGGGLEPVHAELGVHRIEQGHDAGAEGDGDTDGQDTPDYFRGGVYLVVVLGDVVIGPPASIGGGKRVVVPALIHDHVQQGDYRADGYAEDGAGRGRRLTHSGPDNDIGQNQPGDDLEEDLKHLVHGGGQHVAVTLAIAPVGRHQAHQQNGGGHGLYTQGCVRVFKILICQPFREEIQYHGKNHADDEEGKQRDPEGFFLLLNPAVGVGLRHKAGQSHRQAGGCQGEKHIIDIVGAGEHGEALVTEDVPQGNLIYEAEDFHYHNAYSKYGGAVHIILSLYFCHCSPPAESDQWRYYTLCPQKTREYCEY